MELSCSNNSGNGNPKKFLLFPQKKALFIFQETKAPKKFFIFQETELFYISGSISKSKKNPLLKSFIYFGKNEQTINVINVFMFLFIATYHQK